MGPVTTGILGYALDRALQNLTSRADHVIQSSIASMQNAAITVEETAARKALEVIEQISITYQKRLKETVNQIDSTVSTLITELDTTLTDIQNRQFTQLNEFQNRITTLVMDLPFFKTEPRISKMSPRYMAYSTNQTMKRLSFEGIFRYAARPGFEPTLKIDVGGTTLTSTLTTNQSTLLEFDVDFSQISAQHPGSWTQSVPLKGELTIPWNKHEGPWWWETITKVNDSYKFWVGLLPISPGTISVEYTKTTTERHIQSFTSGELHAEGKYPTEWVTQTETVILDPTWTLFPHSVSEPIVFQKQYNGFRSPHGNWKMVKTIEGTHQFSCEIGCSGKDGKHRGVVDYRLNYRAYQTHEKTESKTVSIPSDRPLLTWGETESPPLVYPKDHEYALTSVNFTAFDGKKLQLPAVTDHSNPHVAFDRTGGALRISARQLSDIQ